VVVSQLVQLLRADDLIIQVNMDFSTLWHALYCWGFYSKLLVSEDLFSQFKLGEGVRTDKRNAFYLELMIRCSEILVRHYLGNEDLVPRCPGFSLRCLNISYH